MTVPCFDVYNVRT